MMFPITHPQKRILINQQIYENSKFAYLYGLVRVKDKSSQQIRESIDECIRYFDCLRIRFTKTKDGIFQYFVDDTQDAIEERDVNDDFHSISFRLLDEKLYRFFILVENHQTIGYYFIFHHAIVDAYTVTLITRFIKDFLDNGRVPNPPVSFLSFIHKEGRYLQSERRWEDEDFFRGKIKLSKSYRFIPEFNLKCNRVKTSFSKGDTERVLTFCKYEGISAFKLFLASLFLLFYRESGMEVQTISTTHHNRDTKEYLRMGGMLTSTVPVIYRINPRFTIHEFLCDVTRYVSECLDRHGYPIDLLLAQKEDNGCFDLNITKVLINSIPFGNSDIDMERFSPREDIADYNFKLNPNSKPKGSNIELAVDYRLSVCREDYARLLLERVKAMVFLIMENKDVKICDRINVPRDLMKELQTVFWTNPKRTAVVYKEETITYEDLSHYMDMVARSLDDASHVIGVQNKRCIWYVVAILGILKAGKTFVVLDFDQPIHRMEDILKQTKANPILVFEDEEIDKLSQSSLKPYLKQTINICTFFKQNLTKPKPIHMRDAFLEVSVGELAYILFTSGTTGNPKGVMVSRKGLLSLCDAMGKYYNVKPESQVAAFCHFNFDVSIGEIFLSLYSGSTLHILTEEQRHDLLLLKECLDQKFMDFVFLPTRIGEAYVKHYPKSTIKNLTLVGEKMTYYQPTDYNVFNAYGPTEFTVVSHIGKVEEASKTYCFGHAIDGVSDAVIDEDGKPSNKGELVLVGEQAAIGYLNDYTLTNEKFFITDNKDCTTLQRGFKTGDVVEREEEGLRFLARKDRQIKNRGFRINLDEIESVVNVHNNIDDSLCVVKDNKILLFVVPKKKLDKNKLYELIKLKLPEYYLPHSIIECREIPVNQNGKTDYNAILKSRTKNVKALHGGSQTETRLLQLLKEFSNNDGLLLDANLASIGLDSLDLIQILPALEREFQLPVKFSDFFTYPTIRDLAEHIKDNDKRRLVVKVKDAKDKDAVPNVDMGRPIVMVFDLSGDVMSYFHLINLVQDRPVFFVNSILSATKKNERISLEDFCRLVVARLYDFGEFDSYDLVGNSCGGVFAVEIAKQLQRKANRVFLIDTINYKRYPKRLVKPLSFVIANMVSILHIYGLKNVLGYLEKCVRSSIQNGMVLKEQYRIKEMVRNYEVKDMPNHVTLIASSKTASMTDSMLGWGGLLSNERVHYMNGNHLSILSKENMDKVYEIMQV